MKRAASVPAIWVDKRVPDLSSVLTPWLGIDPEEFARWLAPLLGEYRTEAAILAALPTRSEELTWLDDLMARIEATTELLRPGAIPIRTEALLVDEGYGQKVNGYEPNSRRWAERLPDTSKHSPGVNWFDFRSRLVSDLHLLRTLARRARSRLAAGASRRGRKSQRARDALLAAVIDRLRASGLPELAARGTAEQVLVVCGVAVPEHADSVKRAARKGRK